MLEEQDREGSTGRLVAAPSLEEPRAGLGLEQPGLVEGDLSRFPYVLIRRRGSSTEVPQNEGFG